MKFKFIQLWIIILLISLTGSAFAEKKDTVSYFNPKKGYFHYTKPDIIAQFARFPIPTPKYLHTITVTLTGKKGKCLLHIYGNEGGSSIPLLRQELQAPILLDKTKEGVQELTIQLSKKLLLKQNQFFIGIDGLTDSVYLVTDHIQRKPQCISNDSRYYYQVIQKEGGRFEYGDFAYSVGIVTEPTPTITTVYQKDTTVFRPNTLITKEEYRNLSVADINGDGYLDIIANGKLFTNKNGYFLDENAQKNLPTKEARTISIDFNNDGRIDILSFPNEKDTLGCILYLNTVKGFVPRRYAIPNLRTISSLSVADVNKDGFVDVFVGQYNEADCIKSKLLLNSNGEKLVDHSNSNQLPLLQYSRGSFLADLDADGTMELFVAGAKKQPNFVGTLNFSSGLQLRTTQDETKTPLGNHGIGGMPMSNGKTGEQDIIVTNRNVGDIAKEKQGVAAIQRIHKATQTPIESTYLPFLERASGGVCADINNDGFQDIFLPTTCICNTAQLYLGTKEGFQEATEDYGLTGIQDARDAVFFDADNNGTLDLIVFSGGILCFYRNTGHGAGGYVSLTLNDGTKNGNVGAQVITYVSGERQRKILVSGRGLLMQDPSSVIIGIGNQNQIDSVIVLWNSPQTGVERFGPFTSNSRNIVEHGTGTPTSIQSNSSCSTITDAGVYPNPFTTTTDVHFTLSSSASVSVMIYSFSGSELQELFIGQLEAGEHSLVWNGMDKLGTPVTTGLYIYKIKADGCEVSGQIRVQR